MDVRVTQPTHGKRGAPGGVAPKGPASRGAGNCVTSHDAPAAAVTQNPPSSQANLPSPSGSVYLLPDFAAFGVTSRLPLQSLPTLTLFDADNPAVVAASEMSLGST